MDLPGSASRSRSRSQNGRTASAHHCVVRIRLTIQQATAISKMAPLS
jgi:hypothetical protein